MPSRMLLAVVAAMTLISLGLAIAGVNVERIATSALVAGALLVMLLLGDFFVSRRWWRAAGVTLQRQVPGSLAVGERAHIEFRISNPGGLAWQLQFFDSPDDKLAIQDLPLSLRLNPASEVSGGYQVLPQSRGDMTIAPAAIRIRSRAWLCELQGVLGETHRQRVFPNFSVLRRYAWLAGNQRLSELGIKTVQQRGSGTDFKQLAEYQPGDAIRHIDWKASARLQKPIVRQFQDERDQRVLFLIDCGRRMRADDRAGAAGSSHFDQVLNAVMLLAYVALKRGDAVGAMTFGTPEGEEQLIAPRKGQATLDGLMTGLYALQPSLTHSDYLLAAQRLLSRFSKRALVIVITNFRDEDGVELADALKLLRSRHLVLLASIQEKIIREIIEQPMTTPQSVVDIASAHLFEQSRREAFQRLAARDALMLDVEPQMLAVSLVNRYDAVKKAGLL